MPMLVAYWFQTARGQGYGVTGYSREDAGNLLRVFGYPRSGETIVEVIEGVRQDQLDQRHVVPNAGPMVLRGVWYPNHIAR
jgi:hypothetical protein